MLDLGFFKLNSVVLLYRNLCNGDLFKPCPRVDILLVMNVLVHCVKARVYLFPIGAFYSLRSLLRGSECCDIQCAVSDAWAAHFIGLSLPHL